MHMHLISRVFWILFLVPEHGVAIEIEDDPWAVRAGGINQKRVPIPLAHGLVVTNESRAVKDNGSLGNGRKPAKAMARATPSTVGGTFRRDHQAARRILILLLFNGVVLRLRRGQVLLSMSLSLVESLRLTVRQ